MIMTLLRVATESEYCDKNRKCQGHDLNPCVVDIEQPQCIITPICPCPFSAIITFLAHYKGFSIIHKKIHIFITDTILKTGIGLALINE